MKIVQYDTATVVAIFPIEAFLPLAGFSERLILGLVGDRYGFARVPDTSRSREEFERDGLVFEFGEILISGAPTTINKLSIHRDGIVVGAKTTFDADHVLSDAQQWLINDHGFRPVTVSKLYLSQLVVDFDRPVSRLFKAFDKIMEATVTHMAESGRPIESSAFSQLAIEYKPKGRVTAGIPRFIIDRRVGVPVPEGTERFFCSAPLKTEYHIATLEAIEALMA